jgi:copper(I)-binding protein
MKRSAALVLCTFVTVAFARADTSTLVVSDVWSRPATGTAVVYGTFRNRASEPDRLVGASSPLASRVELHESAETKMPATTTSMGNLPMNDSMMSMKSLSSIPIPAHGTTSLSPGGYHLMLDLRRDIKVGDIIPLRLHFARAGWIATSAQVRPIR